METSNSISEQNIYTSQLHIHVQMPGEMHGQGNRKNKPDIQLEWTASKAALVELIYGLHAAGAFNNGTAEIKQLTGFFESVFNLELNNVYNVFQEIRIRKKNRTSFLDLLRDRLLQRMEETD